MSERAARDEKLDLLTWTIQNRPALVPGRAFDLANHRYLVDIYRDTSPGVVIKKAGQMGASEYAISWTFWGADVHMATPLYVFPTTTHVSDFSSARLGPAIEASPYLQQIVADGGKSGRRGADRVHLKRIGERFLYLRGAQVTPDGRAAQLKSIDADVLVLDELDEMDQRAPEIAVERLGHSRLKWIRWISTPSWHGVGIDAKFAESDQHVWMVRCSCGNWQDVAINDVVMEWDELQRPVAWHGGPDDAWAACRRCGARLNRTGPGAWVPRYPDRSLRGYHITGLISAFKKMIDIIDGLRSTDETKRKETNNQGLGLAHKPTGQQITNEVLDACRRDYGMGPRPGPAYAGIDVGAVLHTVVRGLDEGGERPARFIGELRTFDELAGLLKRYGVVRAVIDAQPETHKARDLQADLGGLVWLAYFGEDKKEALHTWNENEGTVRMPRTRAMDEVFSMVVEGRLTLPANARAIEGYYSQMKAPVRVMERHGRTGNLVARYVESGPDHYALAETYCAAAYHGPGLARPLPAIGGGAKRQR